MSMEFGALAAETASDGRMSTDEILELRRIGWADGTIGPDEAEALFAANDACAAPTREWCDFFVEALSTFIVQTVPPTGYIDDEMGDELIARIDCDGKLGSMAELELLVRVLEIAHNAPDRLKGYALRQVEEAVLNGEGPTRHGELTAKGINETECALLRRLIFAPASDRPAAVSQNEAEMLFRLKDAALYDVNASEWEKLFVQGVANYLFGFGGNEPLSNDRAAELEKFMSQEGAGIGGFLGRICAAKPAVDGAFGSLLDIGPHGPDIDALADEAADLTAEESSWLTDLLEADEELDPMEKALLAWVAEETSELFGLKV
jgi:hypothetical protein